MLEQDLTYHLLKHGKITPTQIIDYPTSDYFTTYKNYFRVIISQHGEIIVHQNRITLDNNRFLDIVIESLLPHEKQQQLKYLDYQLAIRFHSTIEYQNSGYYTPLTEIEMYSIITTPQDFYNLISQTYAQYTALALNQAKKQSKTTVFNTKD